MGKLNSKKQSCKNRKPGSKSREWKIHKLVALCLTVVLFITNMPVESKAAQAYVFLNRYQVEMDIGDECWLVAIATNGEYPTFRSSKSSVVSVNAYGELTAKKAGNAQITVKVKGGVPAICKVVVVPTEIKLNYSSVTMENGATKKLRATTSNGSEVTWKTSKKSVATVDESGVVTAKKPGSATITAKADGTKKTCKVTVKKPEVKLNKETLSMYCGSTAKLKATVSSGISPKWKSGSTKVATVEEDGLVTANKPGTCKITATVDGVKKTCKVTVIKPIINLSEKNLNLKKGKSYTLTATLNYPDAPEWSVSNDTILEVNAKGKITALRKGSAYVYASLYGVRKKCRVKVTENE